MKEFFDKFGGMKSASFIGIKGYENQHGEVADINLLINVDVNEAKKKDLKTLKSLTEKDLETVSGEKSLPMSTLKVALTEMIASGEKNLSPDKSKRTNQSIAQADAYFHLTPAVRLHKETMNVHVAGFLQEGGKKVLVEGVYPATNKREKTICKDAIAYHCDLRMKKYKQYKIGQMDAIKVTGSTLQML